MSCSVFYLVPLTLLMNACTIKGLCQSENCSCGSDLFYDLLSQRCIACPPGYIGINCSIECRFPSYGDHCQSECNCSKENCSVSTGCPHNGQRTNTITGISNESDQKLGSNGKSLDLKRSPGVKVTPVLISTVVVLIVILVAIVCRYMWRKYVVRKKKKEVKHVEELLTFRHLGATNDNLYDLDELNGDVDNEKNEKVSESVDEKLKTTVTVALKSGCSNETNKYFSMSNINKSRGQNGDADEGSRKTEQGSESVDKTFENLKTLKSDHSVETDKHLYDNLGGETVDAVDKEKDGDVQDPLVNTMENDYIDSLAFKVEKKKSCRDSQHVYDSLK
ncbi:uncharacterized protein [Magallana gigas]|uniref:uncharacterized protein n=1 Tax=Magallana gigas TaxID=29159 RepID=UPI003341366F